MPEQTKQELLDELEAAKRQCRRDLGFVISIALIFAGAFLVISLTFTGKVEQAVQDTNSSALKNCRDQNESKDLQARGLRRAIQNSKAEIKANKEADPSVLPALSEEEFRELIRGQVQSLRDSNAQRRRDILKLHGVNCEARFDD
jgi:hypothetical protein